MEGAHNANGIPCAVTAPRAHSMPSLAMHPADPDVPEKEVRRRFTVEYKRTILQKAEASRDGRGIGVLLRRSPDPWTKS